MLAGMCLCSFTDNDEGKTSTYVGVCVSLVVVLWSYSFACSCKSHPLNFIGRIYSREDICQF